MLKSFGKPTRVIGILGLVFLLAFSLSWLACSERHNSTGPQNVVDVAGKISPSQIVSVMAIQNRHTDELLAMQGVVGTATGLTSDGRLAIKVYTENKMITGLPKELDGVPVDVQVTGKFTAFALTGRYRPVPIGVSVGNNNECSAGTISCVVFKGGQKYLLSNNHVLARENKAKLGEVIVQPGRYDNRPICADHSSTDEVANLSQFVTIKFDGSNNTVDCAIALYSTTNVSCATLSGYYGFPSSTTVAAFVGQAIKKVGRTTSLTTGTVTAINATVNVGYSSGTAKFVGQIVTSSGFSKAGDSGSLVVTNNSSNNPVGLLFAGTNSGVTILNPIGSVLSALSVTVCSN